MDTKYVSRAGEKLEHAINTFVISVKDLICADFGSNTCGFVDRYQLDKTRKIIANALKNLKPTGSIVPLVKPHYESKPHMLRKRKL